MVSNSWQSSCLTSPVQGVEDYRHAQECNWPARRTKFTLVLLFWLSNYRSIGPQEIKISQESLVRRNRWGCQRRSLSPGYLQLVKGLAGNSGWDGDGQGHNLARLFGYIYLISYLNLPSYQNLQVILATGLGVTACALASQIHPLSRNQLKEPNSSKNRKRKGNIFTVPTLGRETRSYRFSIWDGYSTRKQ